MSFSNKMGKIGQIWAKMRENGQKRIKMGGDFGVYGESLFFNIQILAVAGGDLFEGLEGEASFFPG